MDFLDVIRTDRVVAVIRAPSVADPVALTETLVEVGIRTVEFTFTIPDVGQVIRRAGEVDGAMVGAGTVVTRDQARSAVQAGAEFLVSPVLHPEVIEAAEGSPTVLAGFSPTEVVAAQRAGASAIKLFPARMGGPEYVSDLKGPFPDLLLIPSGGVDETNASEYLEAGAVAVYAGSSLAPSDSVARGDHDEIARRAKALVNAIS